MITVTRERLSKMVSIINQLKDEVGESGLSWQHAAGLGGVGDITLIADEDKRLAHVNQERWQRSDEGMYLLCLSA